MHELSIAISMIDQLVEESARHGGGTVEAVHLRLGVFCGVDKDALLFAYDLACEGTPLAGSRLLIETIPLVIYCPVCKQREAPASTYQLCCPVCHSPAGEIVSGRELEVVSLEIAT